MKDYKYIDHIIETSDLEEVNELLKSDHILINSYTTTGYNESNHESLNYAIGRINRNRNLPE